MKPLCGALLVLLLTACSAGTPIQVTNRSTIPLHEVAVSGSGFSTPVATILPPGETRTVRVDPQGESGVAVSFRAGDRKFSLPEQGYFEGNGLYAVKVAVLVDYSVSVDGTTKY